MPKQNVIFIPKPGRMSELEWYGKAQDVSAAGYVFHEIQSGTADLNPVIVMHLPESVGDPHSEDNMNRDFMQIERLENALKAANAVRDDLQSRVDLLLEIERLENALKAANAVRDDLQSRVDLLLEEAERAVAVYGKQAIALERSEDDRHDLIAELESMKRTTQPRQLHWKTVNDSVAFRMVGLYNGEVLYSITRGIDHDYQLHFADVPTGDPHKTPEDAEFAAEQHLAAQQQKAGDQ